MTSGGRFDFDDGGTYCGGWEDGKALGYGVCTGPKGQGAYFGAYHNGFEISGIYKWTTGSAYKGQWTQGKRHGLGVESKGRWVYQGEWTQGFKGRYGTRQSTSTGAKYEGTWTTGLQDGYGVETYADGGTYQGQWLRGIRHGYGVRRSVPYGIATLGRQKAGRESLTSLRSENEEDQIVKERDRRLEEIRGGFVLTSKRSTSGSSKRPFDLSSNQRRSNSAEPTKSRAKAGLRKAFEGIRLIKHRSEEFGDVNRSSSPSSTGERRKFPYGSARSWLRRRNDDDSGNKSNTSSSYASSVRHSPISAIASESCASFTQDDTADPIDVETYSGEWKNDRRSGFGVANRTDGLMYEGEWDNNKRHGYGVMTFQDGTKEEGKFKNDVLVSAGRKSKFMILRSNKMKEHVDNVIVAAQRASQIAAQKAEIAVNRMGTARSKADMAMQAASKAQSDAEKARTKAMEYAPDFMTDVEKKGVTISAIPLLGVSHMQSSKGGAHQQYDGAHNAPMDAAASFVSQFTDHYNPQNQLQTAKSFLNRVTKVATSTVETVPGSEETRLPLPSIGNALLSAGLESGLLKSLAHKPMQPLQSSLRQQPTAHNISNGNPVHTQNAFDSSSKRPTSGSSTSSRQTPASTSSSSSSSNQKREAGSKRRLQEVEISMNVPSVRLQNMTPTKIDAPSTATTTELDSRFSQILNQSVLDDHFDQYQSREEATKVAPTARSPAPQATPAPVSSNPANHLPTMGTPWELYQHQQQLQLQLQQQQQFLQQQQSAHQRYNDQFSSDTPFSYDNPRRAFNQNPGGHDPNHDQGVFPPSSYERRQTLPPGKLEEAIKSSFQPIQPGRQEAPAAVRPSIPKSAKEAMGSMPDVSRRKVGSRAREEPAMPREEVHFMSMRRREEIRRMREDEERRRQEELILSFGEFRNWCHQRQLLVFLIAINLGLAAVFFNLLSR